MTRRRAIRTGSWSVPKAVIDRSRSGRRGGAATVALCALVTFAALDAAALAKGRHVGRAPVTRLWPLEFPDSQYIPVSWSDLDGWAEDDLQSAFATFKASCRAILAQPLAPPGKTLGGSLREPCRAARSTDVKNATDARAFFERQFVPLQLAKLGDAQGFVTGYYEPVLEGSRTPTDVFSIPVYRRPSNLFVRGVRQGSNLPNKGQVFRKIGRRKLVPYYDRGEIEDGVLTGRGLEICYLKDQTDLLFMQIQGSGRIRLQDGSTLRLNYDAHNGWPYTPVGRVLIDRNIIPKEEMSMQRIHDWMDANPDAAKDVRRQNKSYVFFREVKLSDKDEAVGAQGVPLTPARSIAVDKALHVYGTPFFIDGKLPLESDKSASPFHRLMIAQDTGSAIVGPARADIYFGAGSDAGKAAGRLRHNIRFTILVPKSLDPTIAARTQLLPEPRPSEKIAKLFPQMLPTAPEPASQNSAASPVPDGPAASEAVPVQTAQSEPAKIPLPQARPELAPQPQPSQSRRRRR